MSSGKSECVVQLQKVTTIGRNGVASGQLDGHTHCTSSITLKDHYDRPDWAGDGILEEHKHQIPSKHRIIHFEDSSESRLYLCL